MISSKCFVCGSSNMRADRALSGRLICNTCGTPFGVGRRVNNKIVFYNRFFGNNRNLLFICIFIFAFILVVV